VTCQLRDRPPPLIGGCTVYEFGVLLLQVTQECATLMTAHSLTLFREAELECCLGAMFLAHQLLAGTSGLQSGLAQRYRDLEGLTTDTPNIDRRLVRLIRSYIPDVGLHLLT
jgi:hypothetical protein